MLEPARRLSAIDPFYVMDVLARARALEAQGRSVIHMEIGEPDFPTVPQIIEAGIAALRDGRTHYTQAVGMPELRDAISGYYPPALRPGGDRVVVTPGASGALTLVFAALINPGDQVLLADPGYPCNRHFVRLFEGEAVSVPVDASTGYQLNADLVRCHWTPRTRAVLVASPSNPTGTLVPPDEMARIAETVRRLGGVLIVDEIYHGLTYDTEATTALACGDDLFVVNSFSKYFGMTGWRLGWIVVPRAFLGAIDKLAQNLFLAANTPAQHAALAAFRPEVRAELDRRRDIFRQRRDYLLPALRELGFGIPLEPQGAFYLYADSTAFAPDSRALAQDLLERTGVAITPGMDFGRHHPERHVRFSYANTIENLREGVRRMREYRS